MENTVSVSVNMLQSSKCPSHDIWHFLSVFYVQYIMLGKKQQSMQRTWVDNIKNKKINKRSIKASSRVRFLEMTLDSATGATECRVHCSLSALFVA